MKSKEKQKQEQYTWDRKEFKNYNKILAYYQAISCVENSKGGILLDLACGDGTLTQIFTKYFDRVVGVDASGKQLEKAKLLLPKIKFIESLIEDFETNERFDSIFMINVLEHVNDPVHVLKKVSGFLSDDGVLVVHVPNLEAVNRKIALSMGTLKSLEELSPYDVEVAGHRRYYNLDSLLMDIENAGLKTKNTGGVFYKMLSTAQMDWFLENGLWDKGGFGWGRVGGQKKDWRKEFCRACYEIGKEKPRDCNIIYASITKK